MVLHRRIPLSNPIPISKENQENKGIFPRHDYLVEGRSEGLEGPKQMTQQNLFGQTPQSRSGQELQPSPPPPPRFPTTLSPGSPLIEPSGGPPPAAASDGPFSRFPFSPTEAATGGVEGRWQRRRRMRTWPWVLVYCCRRRGWGVDGAGGGGRWSRAGRRRGWNGGNRKVVPLAHPYSLPVLLEI